MAKWTFSPKYGCYPFTYGGCGATKNMFDTVEECRQECGDSEGSVCDEVMQYILVFKINFINKTKHPESF